MTELDPMWTECDECGCVGDEYCPCECHHVVDDHNAEVALLRTKLATLRAKHEAVVEALRLVLRGKPTRDDMARIEKLTWRTLEEPKP